MRMRSKPWTNDELEQNVKLILHPDELKGNWAQYFNNQNPIHLELGCGKGRFIAQTAGLHPEINYVAVERHRMVIAFALRRTHGLACKPAFINIDVESITECFAPGEISRIYINFCDPWPNKKKWAKRRLTYRSFIAIYEQLFGEFSGEIFFKTDNEALFDFSVNEFNYKGWRLEKVTRDLHNSGFSENVMTEYEEKYSAQGMPIYRLEAYYTPSSE